MDNDVGRYWRFGYDPHMGDGIITLWAFVHTQAGAYRRVEQFPKRDGDVTQNRFRAGGIADYRFDGAVTHWSLHDGDVVCERDAEPYHTPVDIYRRKRMNSPKTWAPRPSNSGAASSCRIFQQWTESNL